MIQGPMIDRGDGFAVAPSSGGGEKVCSVSAAEKAKSCGASALEQVAAGENAAGPKYKRKVVRDAAGNLVVRFELDLGFGRVTANDHLRQLWHEQLTEKNNKLVLAALRRLDARGHARLAARIAAQVTGSGACEPDEAGESRGESVPSAVATAMFGGRIDV